MEQRRHAGVGQEAAATEALAISRRTCLPAGTRSRSPCWPCIRTRARPESRLPAPCRAAQAPRQQRRALGRRTRTGACPLGPAHKLGAGATRNYAWGPARRRRARYAPPGALAATATLEPRPAPHLQPEGHHLVELPDGIGPVLVLGPVQSLEKPVHGAGDGGCLVTHWSRPRFWMPPRSLSARRSARRGTHGQPAGPGAGDASPGASVAL